MWTIRFLTGSLSGQSYSLKSKTVLGRDPGCDIVIPDAGISKKHAEITIESGQVTIIDLKSSNGTYVNSYRIAEQRIHADDKIGFYQSLAQLGIGQESYPVALVEQNRSLGLKNKNESALLNENQGAGGITNWDQQGHQKHVNQELSNDFQKENKVKINSPDQIIDKANEFINDKIMPNVFHMTEVFSFKAIFLLIMTVYILTVTILSVIPLYVVTSESVQYEAQNRALSIARGIAALNETKLRTEEVDKFSTELMFKEEGVDEVYVVGRDGVVLAPFEISGRSPKHVGFVKKIRGLAKEFVETNRDMVLSAVPIMVFDPEQQVNIAKAHVIVSYNSKTLNFDDSRVFSLFIQVLLIGLLVGGFLFYILYKIIEHSIRSIYQKLDEAIRLGADQIQSNLNFPIIQDFLTILNSLLSRLQNQQINENKVNSVNRLNEILNLIDLMGYPAILIQMDKTILGINLAFSQMSGISKENSYGKTIYDIPDAALQQNFIYLMDQSYRESEKIIRDNIDIGGVPFIVSCQAVRREGLDVDAFVVSISPQEEEG